MKKHQEMIQPLIEDKSRLEYIKSYANGEHPILSSRPCPLCEWNGTVQDGMWSGKHIKFCSYHYAINQLYKLKIEGQKDIWGDEN